MPALGMLQSSGDPLRKESILAVGVPGRGVGCPKSPGVLPSPACPGKRVPWRSRAILLPTHDAGTAAKGPTLAHLSLGKSPRPTRKPSPQPCPLPAAVPVPKPPDPSSPACPSHQPQIRGSHPCSTLVWAVTAQDTGLFSCNRSLLLLQKTILTIINNPNYKLL